MLILNEVISYFKEVSANLKFQVSATITFGYVLMLVWLKEDNELKILLTVLFLFPTCMLLGSLVEKAMAYFKKQRESKTQKLQNKLGQGHYQLTDKLNELWKDKDFEGLGWQIYLNTQINSAYLASPSCFKCKTDVLAKINSRRDGFYLECPDCKEIFDVNDIGARRAVANASFQGEVRRNPKKYFSLF